MGGGTGEKVLQRRDDEPVRLLVTDGEPQAGLAVRRPRPGAGQPAGRQESVRLPRRPAGRSGK